MGNFEQFIGQAGHFSIESLKFVHAQWGSHETSQNPFFLSDYIAKVLIDNTGDPVQPRVT
jgi:hypothetical protein